MKARLEKSIINKLNKVKRDMIWCNTLSFEPAWEVIDDYGKTERIHKINYHFDNDTMIIDDIVFSTI